MPDIKRPNPDDEAWPGLSPNAAGPLTPDTRAPTIMKVNPPVEAAPSSPGRTAQPNSGNRGGRVAKPKAKARRSPAVDPSPAPQRTVQPNSGNRGGRVGRAGPAPTKRVSADDLWNTKEKRAKNKRDYRPPENHIPKTSAKRDSSSFGHGGAAPAVIRRGGSALSRSTAAAASAEKPRPPKKPAKRYRVDPPGTKAKGKVKNPGGRDQKAALYTYRQRLAEFNRTKVQRELRGQEGKYGH